MIDFPIKYLGCPKCKNSVHELNEFIICDTCNKKYPIINGIPVMLILEAINV